MKKGFRKAVILLLALIVFLLPFTLLSGNRAVDIFPLSSERFWLRIMLHIIFGLIALEVLTFLPSEQSKRKHLIIRNQPRDTIVMVLAISSMATLIAWPSVQSIIVRLLLMITGGIAFFTVIYVLGSEELHQEMKLNRK